MLSTVLLVLYTPSQFQHKELQVMFGHVKKVYVDKTGECSDTWLQASSGMYLLPFENVSPDYKDQLIKFLNENNIYSERPMQPSCSTHEKEIDSI